MSPNSPATAAVTGATGFIGGAVVDALLAQGWGVRALARREADAAGLAERGAVTTLGGLGEPAALSRLVAGVDAVVHCAGAVRGGRYADFERVNVDGSAALLEAMAGTGTPLIALSSLAAREPTISDYARSKRAMETHFESITDRAWVALRPPPVYGPGDPALTPLLAVMAHGLAPIPSAPEARLSLLYVTDLAAAIVTWLASPDKSSGVFALHDGKRGGYSWRDIVAIAETLRGKPIRSLTIGKRWLAPIARANLLSARLFGYAPMLTPGKLRELRYPDWVCDNHALEAAIAWRPQVGLVDGLARARQWS